MATTPEALQQCEKQLRRIADLLEQMPILVGSEESVDNLKPSRPAAPTIKDVEAVDGNAKFAQLKTAKLS